MWSLQLSLSAGRDLYHSRPADRSNIRHMSECRTEDEFIDSIGRLASDHAKRSDALQRTRVASADRQEKFLLNFSDQARNEIEPALERVAKTLNQAGRLKASVSQGQDDNQIKLKVSIPDQENVWEILFKADPLRLRVVVQQGSAFIGGPNNITQIRELDRGQAPVVGILTLDQFKPKEVLSRVEALLRGILD